MIGRALSHYEIVEEISRGGMGVVYRARDTKLGRDVAIKVLPPELVADEGRKQRFVQEAKLTAALDHPHVATVFEVGDDEGTTFVAMELIEGEKLQSLLERERLELRRSLDLAIEIAEGLAKAHDKGIVHRDLKPANVMLTADGHAKVIDFGLGKLLAPSEVGDSEEESTVARDLTADGQVLGTPAYMSPEQVSGGDVDARSDVFSFGIVLYELVSGAHPFKATTAAETMTAVLKTPPPAFHASAELQRIVGKSLAKKPDERYQSLRDLIVDLRAERDKLGASTPTTLPFWLYAAAAIAIALGAFLLTRSDAPRDGETHAEPIRIAVLPFDNLGPEDEAYFADGMTEELMSRLSAVSGLAVISRNSAFQYRDTTKPTDQIGAELDVAYLVQGTVRWQGGEEERVRIIPRLIRVSDDTSVWSSTYDEVVEEIFDVQSDVAGAVVRELDIKLVERESDAIESAPTKNVEAHRAYIEALKYSEGVDRGRSSTAVAIELLERAVALDPSFALAWTQLSIVRSWSHYRDFDPETDFLTPAKAAADRAFELSPDLPEAHQAVGLYYSWGLQDYDAAIDELELALVGRPGEGRFEVGIGVALRRQGKWEEALAKFIAWQVQDPRNPAVVGQVGTSYAYARKYDEAESWFVRALALAPHETQSYARLANLSFLRGSLKDARGYLERAPGQPPDRWVTLLMMERRYQDAIARLQSIDRDTPLNLSAIRYPKSRDLVLAEIHRLAGNEMEAAEAFDAARGELEQRLATAPDDDRAHASLGVALAGLGRAAEAVAAGERAIELYSPEIDALEGPRNVEALALIFTMLGDVDAAIGQIDRLLEIAPNFTVGYLELDPRWDPLRDHPRYAQMVDTYR